MTAKTDATCTGPGADGKPCARDAKYKGLCDTHRARRLAQDVLDFEETA